MGGPPVPLKNATDAYVSEKRPSRNYNNAKKLFMANGAAANTRYVYLYFGLPSGMADTTLTNAVMRLYSGNGFSGSVTLTVSRLTEKFSVNRVNWKNKPSATSSNQVSLTKSNAPAGTAWEFNVKPMLQSVANGTAWYGVRVSASGSSAKWLYSTFARDDYRPSLEIAWSDSPDEPENLIPDDGLAVSVAKPTLQWDFVDPSGDETLQSAQIRLFTSEVDADANTSPALDITVPLDAPEFDLDDPAAAAYTGLAEDATLWWRVLNTDGAGLPSIWSEPAYFTRKSKGTVEITNPAAAVDPDPAFVNESTPPFSWTFTGRTQVKYQVILTTPETPAKYIWNSGIITSTDTDITPPAKKITTLGKTYRLIVRIFDDQDRIEVPDDPIYVETSRDFVYQFASSVEPVENLVLTMDNVLGHATFDWTSSTAPDEFVMIRDGKEVEMEEPVELLVSGTSYRWVDESSDPRKEHTWAIARKVNGVTSSANPTVTGFTRVVAPILSQPGGTKPVVLLNPDVDAERVESSDIHYILGSAPPVLVTQSIRGYEGQAVGVLANDVVPGLSADDMLAHMEWFKDNPGQVLKLVWVNKVMEVVVRNVTDEPLPLPDGSVEYLVTFDFFEVGF